MGGKRKSEKKKTYEDVGVTFINTKRGCEVDRQKLKKEKF